MPTWKQTVPITVQYLKELNVPIAKVVAKFSTKKANAKNHFVKECSYPIISGIGVGAVVILLKNYVAELGIVNGCIGTVKEVVYRNRDGPRQPGSLPAYIIIDFPSIDIPEEKKCFPHYPRTTIPVAVDVFSCEDYCCTMETLPLRVCKALSIHKCQGFSVGPGKQWERVVIILPGKKQKNTPGMELVAVSRVVDKEFFAIDVDNVDGLSREDLFNIGKGKSSDEKKTFIAKMEYLAEETQKELIQTVIDMDSNTENKCFDGGFKSLVNWYRELTN